MPVYHISQVELQALTEFQKSLHTTQEGDSIFSNFHYEFSKVTWYSTSLVKMNIDKEGKEGETADEEKIIRYIPNRVFHYLMYTRLRQRFPAVAVKPEYRGKIKIRMTDYPGINVIEKAEMEIGEDVANTLDPLCFDLRAQYYGDPGHRSSFPRKVGNVPALIQWQDSLPTYTTNVRQPFYYSQTSVLAFPLHLCPPTTGVHHTYAFRRNHTSLLRMAQKEGEVWNEIPVDKRYLDTTKDILPLPELWARYAYVTTEEKDNCISWEDGKKVYYIDDFVACDAEAPTPAGGMVKIPLSSKDYPCKALFWVGENVTSKAHNGYSNYTTDSVRPHLGSNPCRTVTLSYGERSRLKNMDSDHFEWGEAEHFPTSPMDIGYNAYSICLNSATIDAEVGVVMDRVKANLSVTFDAANKEVFHLRSRLLITRKLTIEKGEKENTFSLSP